MESDLISVVKMSVKEKKKKKPLRKSHLSKSDIRDSIFSRFKFTK